MIRRGILALALTPALSALAAACSPIGALNALAPRDPGVRRVAHDIAYGEGPRRRLDIYAPDTSTRAGSTAPVLVFFYGGGWDSGSRGVYGWAAQALAARGFVVAVPDYRLSPEVHFPGFLEDAAAATAKVGEVAARYGGDPAHLGVLGHSAGAHLALMIALDGRYMAATGSPNLIKAAAGLSGPYDFLPFDVAASRNAFGRARDPAQTQPVTFARRDGPAVWLGHGTDDDVVETIDTNILNDRILAAGGRSEFRLYEGLNHADTIAAFSPLFRNKAPVLDDVTAFFHRTLG